MKKLLLCLFLCLTVTTLKVIAWTGEIRGRVVCDVCGDSTIGPEDHFLEVVKVLATHGWCGSSTLHNDCLFTHLGAEVAVLCITKSGEVVNYQAFTDSRGLYSVAETMPESERWDSCLARPIASFHEHCSHHTGVGWKGKATAKGVRLSYDRPSGHSYTIRPFVYRHANSPSYCM